MSRVFRSNNLPSFFFLLVIVGYDMVTSLFSFALNDGESRMLTIPFRAFELFIAILTLLFFFKKPVKASIPVKILWLFWFLLLARYLWDVFVMEKDAAVISNWRIETFLFIVPLAMFPMYVLQKTYDCIDFEKCFLVVYVVEVISVLMTFINNPSMGSAASERLAGNVSMGALETGYLGSKAFILSVLLFLKYKMKKPVKLVVVAIIGISFVVMLRSGGRGPLLAATIAGGCLIYTFVKRKALGLGLLLIIASIFLLFETQIIELVRGISPILVERFEKKAEIGGQLNDRQAQYIWAWNQFKNHPLLGGSFALFTFEFSFTGVGYTHNAFIETLMQLGIVGGVLFLYLYYKAFEIVLRFLREKKTMAWLGLILVIYMVKIMVSSAFYLTPVISVSMIILFSIDSNYKNIKIKKKNTTYGK